MAEETGGTCTQGEDKTGLVVEDGGEVRVMDVETGWLSKKGGKSVVCELGEGGEGDEEGREKGKTDSSKMTLREM